MAAILEIVLQNPWNFIGTVILIFVTAAMIEYIVRGRKK